MAKEAQSNTQNVPSKGTLGWLSGVSAKDLALYLAGPCSVVLLWEFVGRTGLLANGLFPPFSLVVASGAEWVFGFGNQESIYSGTWFEHALASTLRILVGFSLGSLLGATVGVLVGWSSVVRKLIDPSVNIIRPISVTAWVPLALIIFGIGNKPAIFLTALGTFFPVYINTYSGVRYAEANLVRAARMLGANGLQQLIHVVLPAALPSIFTGMRVGAAIAWTTVVVAEILGAQSGLGYVLIDSYNQFRFPYVIAAMFSVGFLGFITDQLLQQFGTRRLRWVGKGAGDP